jgi:hypothetical protein
MNRVMDRSRLRMLERVECPLAGEIDCYVRVKHTRAWAGERKGFQGAKFALAGYPLEEG